MSEAQQAGAVPQAAEQTGEQVSLLDQIVDLVHRDSLAHQFLVNAIDPLDAAFHRSGDPCFFELVAQH